MNSSDERDEAELESAIDTVAEWLHEQGFSPIRAKRIAEALGSMSEPEWYE